MFKYAEPVFLKTKIKKDGLTGFFAANFDCEKEDAHLTISCLSACKVTVNGEYVCYIEPEVNGYMIEAFEYDICEFVSWGLNQIVIEVFSGKAEHPFVIAEVVSDGTPVCATGKNFTAFIDMERLPEKPPVKCENLEYYKRGGICMMPCEASVLPTEFLYNVQKLKSTSAISEFKKTDYPLKLSAGESFVFDFGKDMLSTIKFEALCSEPSVLVISSSETKDFDKKNIIIYDMEAGEYENESFSPHKHRYVLFKLEKGEVSLYNVALRK